MGHGGQSEEERREAFSPLVPLLAEPMPGRFSHFSWQRSSGDASSHLFLFPKSFSLFPCLSLSLSLSPSLLLLSLLGTSPHDQASLASQLLHTSPVRNQKVPIRGTTKVDHTWEAVGETVTNRHLWPPPPSFIGANQFLSTSSS